MGSLKLREDFRRDGLAANFLADARMMKLLARSFPDSIINVGYPALCKRELLACKKIIKALSVFPVESAVVGHAWHSHLKYLKEAADCASNTSVNVWVPCSSVMIAETSKIGIASFIDSCVKVVEEWTGSCSTPIDVALVDCMSRENGLFERVIVMAERFLFAGCRRVILCDTMGKVLPKEVAKLFCAFRGRDIPFEFHGHNDKGFLVANIETAIEHGSHVIGASAFGIGERMTMGDSYKIAETFKIPIERHFYDNFCELYSVYEKNHPDCVQILSRENIVTGPQLILRSEHVGAAKIKFAVTSDRRVLGHILGIPYDRLDQGILRRIKDEMYERQVFSLPRRELQNFYKNCI